MGIYDPKKDQDIPSRMEQEGTLPQTVSDSVRSVLSKTNDFTADSVSRLMNMSRSLWNGDTDFQTFFGDTIGNNSFFKSLYGSESRPDGYLTYPVPSTELYQKCKEKQGLSAWDTSGYWHCVFPRAQIPAEAFQNKETVCREDIENDWDHKKYGVFFENFNDLMDWRVSMQKIVKRDSEKRWAEYRQQEKAKWDFLNEDKSESSSSSSIYDIPAAKTSHYGDSGPGDNLFRGSSSSTLVNTLENGDLEKTTRVTRWHGDGTSEQREYKEIIDGKTGQAKAVDRHVTPNAGSAGTGSLKKGGWFWNKKGGDE